MANSVTWTHVVSNGDKVRATCVFIETRPGAGPIRVRVGDEIKQVGQNALTFIEGTNWFNIGESVAWRRRFRMYRRRYERHKPG